MITDKQSFRIYEIVPADRETRHSVLDLNHHAFARTVSVAVMIIDFLFVLIGHRPVKLHAMLVVAHRKIDLLDGDRFHSHRIPGALVNSVGKFLGFSFFPQAEGKFETSGRGPSVSIGSSIVKAAEASALFVDRKDLPLRSSPFRIDSFVNRMSLSGRRVLPFRRSLDRVRRGSVAIVSINLWHIKISPTIPFNASPKLHRNESFFGF
jgi:hypothetical protein